ncbi:MAG: hypothetical protein AB7U99_09630, partial [Steroidobacteraceae bacterium]
SPRVEQQRELRSKNYPYPPRTPVVRQERSQPTQRAPVTGRTTQEPSRNNSDARNNERIEPRDASPQQPASVGKNTRQQPSPPAQQNTERQRPDQSSGTVASQRNENPQQPKKKPNLDKNSERNKEDQRKE